MPTGAAAGSEPQALPQQCATCGANAIAWAYNRAVITDPSTGQPTTVPDGVTAYCAAHVRCGAVVHLQRGRYSAEATRPRTVALPDFLEELQDLIVAHDDLSIAEVVGAMESVKFDLFASAGEDDGEEEDG